MYKSNFAFLIIALSALGCGTHQQNSQAGTRIPAEESIKPKITETQFKMIESSDLSLATLGWSSIAANAQLGARASAEQLIRLKTLWEKTNNPVASRAMHILKDPSFEEKETVVSGLEPKSILTDDRFLKLLRAEDPISLELVTQAKKDSDQFIAPYSYQEFLNTAKPTSFRQGTVSPFLMKSNISPQWIQTSPTTQFAIQPGKLDPSKSAILNLNFGPTSSTGRYTRSNTEILTLEQLSRDAGVIRNLINLDMLTQPFREKDLIQNIRCYTVHSHVYAVTRGATYGNGESNQDATSYTCVSFNRADSPSTPYGHTSRYQISLSGGGTILPPPGTYSTGQIPPNLNNSLEWYQEHPYIQSTFTQQIPVKTPWIEIKLSKSLSNEANFNYLFGQYPTAIGLLECKSGCIYPYPISNTSDGTLIFALSGLGSATFAFETPMPFVMNFLERKAITINIDVSEPSDFTFADVSDTSELPKLSQALKENQFTQFNSIWSSGLQASSWTMPEFSQAELRAPTSLYRLSLLNDLIQSNVKSITKDAESAEFKTAILSAHARSQIPVVEKIVREKSYSKDLLTQVDQQLSSAIRSLSHLSSDDAYFLLGRSSNALNIEKPEIIKDKEVLSEAIIGAWQLVHEELLQTDAALKIVCSSISKMNIETDLPGSQFVLKPQAGTLQKCQK